MTPKQRLLAEYTRRIMGNTTPEEAANSTADQHQEAAASALESVNNERAFRPGTDAVLEAIVLPQYRPALLIRNDSFDVPPSPWEGVAAFTEPLRPVIRAIGRVEVTGSASEMVGTGFLCGPGLMLTNRHVAQVFLHGPGGPGRLNFISGRHATMDTGRERFPGNGMTFIVDGALMIHPHWDAAVLRVRPEDPEVELPAPLPLVGTDPGELEGREVVVVGYPYSSEGHDPKLLREVFGGNFGVKRLQPGKLMAGRPAIKSFSRMVEALSHDASTLGGNSGSAVIDLETQQVLALHFSGAYLKANYAVPLWELARDPRLVDAGLNFMPAPSAPLPRTSEAGGPIWLDAWRTRDAVPGAPAVTPAPPRRPATATPVMVAPAAPVVGVPAPAVPAVAALAAPIVAVPGGVNANTAPDWFERTTDDELRRMYQRDPEGTRRLIALSYNEAEAQDLYDTVLLDSSVEGVLEASPDPDLPEIVLLPGIMGSHLRGSGHMRAWLNFFTLPFSNLLRTLGLDRNGNDPNGLAPAGYVESYYEKAERTWRQQGFKVHQFPYDWRKPLSLSARRLDTFLRDRRQARPEAKFALVGHSMGGLVAALYAKQTADWRDFVEQAVLCGTPLGGSFAIMEMLSGQWASVQKLAMLSMGTSLEEMRQMGAGFPGALEMLPHPGLFNRDGLPDVEKLYRAESYAPSVRPGADWLQSSRLLKDALRTTPLLGRATCLVCVDRPTATSFVMENDVLFPHIPTPHHSPLTTRGDGTVAAISALVSGVPAYRVNNQHGDLMSDPLVLEAVPQLLKGGEMILRSVTSDVVNEPLAKAVAEAPLEVRSAQWQVEAAEIRERMTTGIGRVEDARWLLRTD